MQACKQLLRVEGAPQAALRYGLARAPKLVEIIAAVPEEHKATLVPQ